MNHAEPGGSGLAVLLADFQSARKRTADEWFAVLYPELRRMAARHMAREAPGHSWRPTVLVNELYLELLKNKALDQRFDESQRGAFMGLAGFLMRRLLVLHSRPLRNRVEQADLSAIEFTPSFAPDPEQLQTVESLLDCLAGVDPKIRSVVEMRVFEGKTHEEIAAQLGCSVRTVGTCWAFARRWLQNEFRDEA